MFSSQHRNAKYRNLSSNSILASVLQEAGEPSRLLTRFTAEACIQEGSSSLPSIRIGTVVREIWYTGLVRAVGSWLSAGSRRQKADGRRQTAGSRRQKAGCRIEKRSPFSESHLASIFSLALSSAFCFLLSASCFLLPASCFLPSASCLLPLAVCALLTGKLDCDLRSELDFEAAQVFKRFFSFLHRPDFAHRPQLAFIREQLSEIHLEQRHAGTVHISAVCFHQPALNLDGHRHLHPLEYLLHLRKLLRRNICRRLFGRVQLGSRCLLCLFFLRNYYR